MDAKCIRFEPVQFRLNQSGSEPDLMWTRLMFIAKVAKPKITQAILLDKWCANPGECVTLASHYERHMSNKEYKV